MAGLNQFAEKYQLALQTSMQGNPEGGLCGFELEWNLLDSALRPLLKVGSGPSQQSFVDYLRAECLSPNLKEYSQLEVFHWMIEWATRPYYHLQGSVYEGRLMEAVLINALHQASREFNERLYTWYGNLPFLTSVSHESIPTSWPIAKRRYLERCVDLYGDSLATAGTHTNLSLPDALFEWERWTPANQPNCGIITDTLGLPYDGSGIDVIAKKKHFSNRMSTCYGVNKPVWLTELGLQGSPTDAGSLRDQAYYVIKGYTRGLSTGIRNITWYALATPNDPYEQSLLFNDSLTPKPAYITYQTMSRELEDYRYVRALNIPGGEAYVFERKCFGVKTVAWGNNVPLTFSPASSLRVVNYLGSVSTITDGGPGDNDGVQNHAVQVMLASDPMSGSTIVDGPVPIPVFINVISY